MPKQVQPIFFDTVVLSNFALIDRFDLIPRRYPKNAYITQEVRDEITDGVVAHFHQLNSVEEAIFKGALISFHDPWMDTERADYQELLTTLGRGEASCIARALHHGGTVITDDRVARQHCKNLNIPYSGTLGVLKACVQDNMLLLDEADEMLLSMIQYGFYSPVQSIRDVL